MTSQERALKKVKRIYGPTGFTEHHVNYFLVGFKKHKQVVNAVGDTWNDAFLALEKKQGVNASKILPRQGTTQHR